MKSGFKLQKITTLLFSWLFFLPLAHSQQYFCGHSHAEHEHLEALDTTASHMRVSAGGTIYYPIQAHILKKNADTAATTSFEVVQAILTLNKNWEQANIQFYLSNPIQFVTDTFYNYNSLYEQKMTSLYNRAGVINIYFVKSILFYQYPQDMYPSNPIGLSPVGGSSSGPIIVDGDFTTDNILLTHEMGHYFSLNHVTQDGSGNYMQPAVFEGAGNFTAAQYTAINKETTMSRKTIMAKSSLDPVATPSDLKATFIEFSKIKLSWKDNASNELGYIIEKSSSPDSGFVQINLADINSQEIGDYVGQSNTVYYYRIRAGNAPTYSQVASVKTGTMYCHAKNEATCKGILPDVSMKSLAIATAPSFMNTNSDCSGYEYMYQLPAKLQADSSYPFTITMATTAAAKDQAFINNEIEKYGNTSLVVEQIQYKLNIVIWIDLNMDGVFDATEKKYDGFAAKNSTIINGTLSLPAMNKQIKTLMRIRAIWRAAYYYTYNNNLKINDPCLPHTEGETEDYVIEIGDVVTALESSESTPKTTFYPNPSHGKLFLSPEIVNAEILDLNGNVLSQLQNTASNEIELPTLSNGVYLLRLLNTNGTSSFDKLLLEK